MSLFETTKLAMPKAAPKAPAVPLVKLTACDSLEDLGEKLAEVKSQKKYVSFRSMAVAMGKEGAFRPGYIPVILHAISEIDPGLQALIVNESGQHAAKVAETHRATLEGYGYEAFPEVKKAKAKKVAEVI